MARAAILIFLNEFRLLAKDRVGLFMLILAPIVIIAVAGFSLGNIYGARPGRRAYTAPLVDEDHGAVAAGIIETLKRQPSISVRMTADIAAARKIVAELDHAPLAIVIPRGTTDALAQGRPVRLMLYVDPIKRIEANAIELYLSELCEGITTRIQDRARKELSSRSRELRERLARLNDQIREFRAKADSYQRLLQRGRAASQRALETQLQHAIDGLRKRTRIAAEQSAAQAQSRINQELAPRREALDAVNRYVEQLQATEKQFDEWLAALKRVAGSRASRIPPPPTWPAPPTEQQLAILSKPLGITVPEPAADLPKSPKLAIKLPEPPPFPNLNSSLTERDASIGGLPTLPGNLGWAEQSLNGGNPRVNAFDQYVPGFGITFLLIGMLMGISLGLIDDRDWGTLQRLRVSGAPLIGILIGKLLSRFLIGLAQLVLLFAIGWWIFGVSLGRYPAMLLLPALAISFAAAAFGLIIACVARTHDSVMPIGAVVSMAMSAIGGCWWPIGFEPAWMRAIAQWVPTTWTMRAFNDLMIRNAPPAAVLWPSAAIFGLGLIYLVAGLIGTSLLYDR